MDAPAIGQALDHLLAGAIEATREGGTVRVRAWSGAGSGAIEVGDESDGIPPDALPKLFHVGAAGQGRAGLGLAVAKQIVRGHGGSIAARSDGPGRGATIRIELPLD